MTDIDQGNRTESLHRFIQHGQLISDKMVSSSNGERTVSLANDAGTGFPKEMRLNSYLIPYTKLDPKWNKDSRA